MTRQTIFGWRPQEFRQRPLAYPSCVLRPVGDLISSSQTWLRNSPCVMCCLVNWNSCRTVMVFSEPSYPRYAIDLSHPAIRYAIAAAISVSGRYFPKERPMSGKYSGPCLPDQFPRWLTNPRNSDRAWKTKTATGLKDVRMPHKHATIGLRTTTLPDSTKFI